MFVISDIIKSIGMDIQYLFSILKKSNWLTGNGTGVTYSFLNLEIINNNVLSGMVYIGEKLVDFELTFQDIIYNTFRIDKYTFLVKSSEAITVFVDGDESNTVPLIKMRNLK
ncbi:MAG: hypothetical protein ACTHJT_06150 [Cytophaga sp.]|uniref:hypothetical protein n=1 Tax=Cytophaga sp. TaxID=29535 RepID=UPI003F808EB3